MIYDVLVQDLGNRTDDVAKLNHVKRYSGIVRPSKFTIEDWRPMRKPDRGYKELLLVSRQFKTELQERASAGCHVVCMREYFNDAFDPAQEFREQYVKYKNGKDEWESCTEMIAALIRTAIAGQVMVVHENLAGEGFTMWVHAAWKEQ